MYKAKPFGYTLIELISTVAIVGILVGAGVIIFRGYSERATSTELIGLYDAIRENTIIVASEHGIDLCIDPPTSLVTNTNPTSPYASLSVEEQLFKEISNITPSYRAEGCESCVNTGYMGRLPVVEIFEIRTEIAQTISDGKITTEQLKSMNHEQNKSLAGSASRLVISGEATVFEAARVIGKEFWTDLAYEFGTTDPATPPVLTEDKENLSAIILISSDKDLISAMENEFDEKHIKCYSCQTTEEANQLLHEHEEIFFIVFGLDDQADEDNIDFVRSTRIELYRSHIPYLSLLSANRPELKNKLIADGSTSEIHIKPVDVSLIYERVRAYTLSSFS
jgi:prepilin-type N-terminal cleavage/methylation domain-containing protein